ncbi:MAG: AMP-binding protein [Bacteroidia bacterium]|nr:AMP-binding protein [Bacteroidia bacterium]MCF8445937.1 AMP-binding protein [Bacteroidia bacterium]
MIFDIDIKEPSTVALKDDGGNILKYGELANILRDKSDILPKRSLVFVLADNSTSVVSFLITCFENKWVPLLLNGDLDSLLLENYIHTYKPNAIFSMGLNLGLDVYKTIGWDNYKIDSINSENLDLHDDLSFLLPTSGSTGSPKLVRHSYNNIIFSAKSVSSFFEIQTSDVGLGILPVYYTMGFSVITSHLQAGAKVVLSNYSLTDRGFWDILKNDGITILTGVPYTFEVMFKMRFERIKIESLRIISQGGGKLSESLWNGLQVYAEKNNIQFIPTYGQTEGTARMSYLESESVKEKIGSIGKAIPGGYFDILGENNTIIEEIEASGELIYRGDNVTLGYAEALQDLSKGDERFGVLNTGDIVRRDKDSFYFIIGRKKRFLKIFGLRISLDEVESLIKNNFETDCYASGDDTSLKVFTTNIDIVDELKMWLSSKLNLFHQAIHIDFIEEIPRNTAGKVIFNK